MLRRGRGSEFFAKEGGKGGYVNFFDKLANNPNQEKKIEVCVLVIDVFTKNPNLKK